MHLNAALLIIKVKVTPKKFEHIYLFKTEHLDTAIGEKSN